MPDKHGGIAPDPADSQTRPDADLPPSQMSVIDNHLGQASTEAQGAQQQTWAGFDNRL